MVEISEKEEIAAEQTEKDAEDGGAFVRRLMPPLGLRNELNPARSNEEVFVPYSSKELWILCRVR